MIVYASGAEGFISGIHPVVPAFTISEEDVLVEAGSSGPAVHEDANVIENEGATIDHNATITSDSFVRSRFISLDPDIATVTADGLVVRVSDGTARILATTGPNTQRLDVTVSRTDPDDLATFVSWVSGSMAYFVAETVGGILDGISGSSGTRSLFSSGSTRNPALFCAAYAQSLTAIAKSANGSSHIGFTSITPRHVVSCAHAGNYVGQTLDFVTLSGSVVSRTITHVLPLAESWTATDIYLYLLDSDLPETITPMPLLPSDIGDYLRHPQYGVPLLFADRDNLMNLGASNFLTASVGGVKSPAQELSGFYTTPVSGTSGKPIMLPVSETELALVATFTSPGGGPSYHTRDWESLISAVDALAEIDTGYLPAFADLSSFTNFNP